ncbi:mycothiol synthase [Leucobacter japonicus]|uniref:mycothiol synthase n=1 Tax=Leucobacter japonicus TaxID=1461259 RepID=UPI0006A77227|nr:mycothiol synthase [Leucobacter japonicus]
MTRLESHIAERSSDFETARAIAHAAEAHDGSAPVSDQAMLAATQGERTLLLFTDAGDPDPVAFGIVGDGEVDLAVLPEARGRGVGRAALSVLLETAGDEAAFLAWAHGVNPAAESLLTGAGFTPVRSLYRMALDPALLPDRGQDPLTLDVPPGFTLRPFDPAQTADAGVWVRANASAFATHPEQGRITEADFALICAEPWFDADDLLLLISDAGADSGLEAGEAAGSTWIKTVRGETVETELYAVGVRPEFAGRGIGRLLLEATLARMAQHSPDRVSLYVDGENTRAVELYERAGFTIDSRSRQWRRPPVSVPGATMDA